MKTAKKKVSELSQEAVDAVVVSRTEEESGWQAPMTVKRSEPASLSVPGELAARAAFLARLHHEPSVDRWVERIVRERVELEELALTQARKKLAS